MTTTGGAPSASTHPLINRRSSSKRPRDAPKSRLAPITIEAPRRLDLDVGNIKITDCIIRDSLSRLPIALAGSPMARPRNLSGSLTVESPDGQHSYKLDAAQLAKWFPTQGLVAKIPQFVFEWQKTKAHLTGASAAAQRESFRLRREAALLVWGEAGRPLELVTQIEPVGRHTPSAGVMTVTAPSGETMKLKPEAKEQNSAYNFTPQRTGPHRLHWQGDSAATLRPVHCSAPVAILGEPLGMNLIRPVGTVHFAVPTGVRRFALQIAGQGTAETVKATIRDATGRTVDQGCRAG